MRTLALIGDCRDGGGTMLRMGMRVRMMKIIIDMMMMTMSIDLLDHCTLSVFYPILPYVEAAAVGPEKL